MNGWKDRIIEEALPHVQMPAQYVGAEWNMARKDPAKAVLRFCLAFPDTYALGMSCMGVQVLYAILNRREDTYAERAFAPWADMERQLRSRGIPLCSLETHTPLRDFDAVGFSLQYEMAYTNLLNMLELGGLPILAADRTARDPIVVAGGPCALNPEPLADFVDLFIFGEAEERIKELADALIALKRSRPARREEAMLFLMKRVANSYAPALYEAGATGAVTPRREYEKELPLRIEAATVADLEGACVPERPVVPYVETPHDRISIEIMRGCWRGCRYCHAGMTRRPVRWRSVEEVVRIAERQYAATGYSEISLASLSSSDYPDLRRLVAELSARFADRKVSIALPSLRVSDQLAELPGMLNEVRKSTLTIAPEAATERLRRVINKDISEEDLYRGVTAAFEHGWNHVKLYFMVGLPTETDEDVTAIARVAERVSQLRRGMGKSPARVNLSVAPFVPKPHTPFQWEPMASLTRISHLSALLRRSIRQRMVTLKFHKPERSHLEGVFARGDRRLGKAVLEAFRGGCRFDAWDETFNFVEWMRAFEKAGVRAEEYANLPRRPEDPLPWAHVSAGVSHEFLLRERERAFRQEFTPDCRAACAACGASNCAHSKSDGPRPTDS